MSTCIFLWQVYYQLFNFFLDFEFFKHLFMNQNYKEVDGIVWVKKSMDFQTSDTEQKNENNSNDSADSEHELENEFPLNDEQIWDDSLLIEMYEKSQKKINEALFKKQVNDQSTNKTEDKKIKNKNAKKNSKCPVNNNNHVWKSGDFCRLVYLEDNVEYEAQILSINSEEKTCHICYIGYENEELRSLADLKPSAGPHSRDSQAKIAEISKTNEDNKSFSKKSSIIPPPAPFFLENNSSSSFSEDDALASMLMSWYMAGYHTGYYQAQKDLKKSNFKSNS